MCRRVVTECNWSTWDWVGKAADESGVAGGKGAFGHPNVLQKSRWNVDRCRMSEMDSS
jgi:hypothetical protein